MQKRLNRLWQFVVVSLLLALVALMGAGIGAIRAPDPVGTSQDSAPMIYSAAGAPGVQSMKQPAEHEAGPQDANLLPYFFFLSPV